MKINLDDSEWQGDNKFRFVSFLRLPIGFRSPLFCYSGRYFLFYVILTLLVGFVLAGALDRNTDIWLHWNVPFYLSAGFLLATMPKLGWHRFYRFWNKQEHSRASSMLVYTMRSYLSITMSHVLIPYLVSVTFGNFFFSICLLLHSLLADLLFWALISRSNKLYYIAWSLFLSSWMVFGYTMCFILFQTEGNELIYVTGFLVIAIIIAIRVLCRNSHTDTSFWIHLKGKQKTK